MAKHAREVFCSDSNEYIDGVFDKCADTLAEVMMFALVIVMMLVMMMVMLVMMMMMLMIMMVLVIMMIMVIIMLMINNTNDVTVIIADNIDADGYDYVDDGYLDYQFHFYFDIVMLL